MNILESFGAYVDSQRAVSLNFMILCGVLILIALIAHFAFPSTTLTVWLKRSLVLCGLLIAVGGFSYYGFNQKVEKDGRSLYERNSIEFKQSEQVRMDKVLKQFPYYQIILALLVILSLIVIIFVPLPKLKGIAFACAMLFIGCMVVEQISHHAILEYVLKLKTL